MKRIEIWFGGIGGQGVVYAANLLGQAAGDKYDYVAATAHYGPESRGGLTSAELVLAQLEINNHKSAIVEYPYIESPNILVIMHQRSVADIPKDLTALTHVIYDSTLISDNSALRIPHSALIVVPATQLARESASCGNNIQMANLILLGALVKATRIVEPEAVLAYLKDAAARRALELGLNA